MVHNPLRKRLKMHTKEDTRPIAVEAHVAKIIVALILLEMDSWVMSLEQAYMAGR